MKTLLVAMLLALTVPALAQNDRVLLTLQLDEAAADQSTRLIPGRVTVANVTTGPILGSVRIYSYDASIVLGETSWRCTQAGFETHCTFGELPTHGQTTLDFAVRLPERAGRATVTAAVDWSKGPGDTGFSLRQASAVMWERFAVSNAHDAGAGSLRAAIEAVNAEPVCAKLPCRIEIAGPSLIQPETALPALVAGDVEVITNGQPVELLGATLKQGNGLHIRGGRMTVRGLALTAFPDSGILYEPAGAASRFTVEQCSITRNGGRGITIGDGRVLDSFIRENYIAQNVRSGIFVLASGPDLAIGLTIAGNAIGANGASGIFLGPQARQTLVAGNTIAHNAEFGIAVAEGAVLVRFGVNRILANGQSGIDYHLNGPSGEFGFTNRGAVATMQTATYDALTNTTTITATGPRDQGWLTFDYAFYANRDADAEGEEFIGSAHGLPDGRVMLTAAGDLRGKYITAVITRGVDAQYYESYEFSAPIRVE